MNFFDTMHVIFLENLKSQPSTVNPVISKMTSFELLQFNKETNVTSIGL